MTQEEAQSTKPGTICYLTTGEQIVFIKYISNQGNLLNLPPYINYAIKEEFCYEYRVTELENVIFNPCLTIEYNRNNRIYNENQLNSLRQEAIEENKIIITSTQTEKSEISAKEQESRTYRKINSEYRHLL